MWSWCLESFSEQDIAARMPSAARAYVRQQHAYEENRRNEVVNHGASEGLPPSFSAGLHPWDNPEYAEFFDSTIGQDVKMRWPMAAQRLDDGVQTYTTELMARLRAVALEFNDKLKASTAQ
jgi:hypothetical protein